MKIDPDVEMRFTIPAMTIHPRIVAEPRVATRAITATGVHVAVRNAIQREGRFVFDSGRSASPPTGRLPLLNTVSSLPFLRDDVRRPAKQAAIKFRRDHGIGREQIGPNESAGAFVLWWRGC
jgi:hypothetical protein